MCVLCGSTDIRHRTPNGNIWGGKWCGYTTEIIHTSTNGITHTGPDKVYNSFDSFAMSHAVAEGIKNWKGNGVDECEVCFRTIWGPIEDGSLVYFGQCK